MNRLFAALLSILVVATFVAAPLLHGAASAAGHQMASDRGSHAGMHVAESGACDPVASVCEVLCVAEAWSCPDHPRVVWLAWHGEDVVDGIAFIPRGTAPEVPERPPKRLLV